jgi:hypothetical protein
LDTGARGFPPRQVAELADWYGLTEGDRLELLALVTESRKRAWWQQIELADSYRTLIGMEDAARSINEYDGSVVPGLLQTRDYARAAAAGDNFGRKVMPEVIERAASVRARRQEILYQDHPPELRVVIDEAVLARTTGGEAVMRAQLGHLLEMSTRAGVSVQVVGFERGVYPGCSRGHFILVDMGEELPDVLYREGIDAPEDTSDNATLDEYWLVWEQLRTIALDHYASRAKLEEYRSRLRG